MSQVSARAVFQMVASAVPPDCREHMIVVGSLAAGYHFFGRDESRQVRTKDIDCILVPRVSAVRTAMSVAERLLAAGWSHRPGGATATPGQPRLRTTTCRQCGFILRMAASGSSSC